MPTRRLINRWWTHALTACFFLLSVVPSAVFAANEVIATNNCHIVSSLYGVPYPGIPGDDSVKKYGVTRDVNSYYARFKDSMAAAIKNDGEASIRAAAFGAYSHCATITVTPIEVPYRNGSPVYDLLSDNTLVLASLISSPRWLAGWVNNNPDSSCDLFRSGSVEIIAVSSLYAPLQKVNQPFHHFSDESVDLINTTCLTGGKCSIRLSGPGGTNGALADVEPGKVVSGLRAEVTCEGAAANKAVTLTVEANANTGGHNHHDSARPPGALSPASGNSPVTFSFTAPAPAGDHIVTAKCVDGSCGEDTGKVWVGVKDLYQLNGSTAYELIQPNADVFHPGNHYLTANASIVLQGIASEWRTLYKPFGPVLHLNDASLERGGYFDIQRLWNRGEHAEHRRGTVIDIRANNLPGAIPRGDFKDFERAARKYGAVARLHKKNTELQHYHVRLFGRPE